MLPILQRLFGALNELFESEETSRKKNKLFNQLTREIEYAQNLKEWEDLDSKMDKFSNLYGRQYEDDLLTLERRYERKGVELNNRLRIKPMYPRPRRF
jgi:hypothetical protein